MMQFVKLHFGFVAKCGFGLADAVARLRGNIAILRRNRLERSFRLDGQPFFTGVLDAAQRRTVAASRTVWLKVGNAGGVNVLLNGKPIGPLGDKGVVRTLQLTSGGFKILPPDEPKPAPAADSPDPL